jgi:hypothetical protein
LVGIKQEAYSSGTKPKEKRRHSIPEEAFLW